MKRKICALLCGLCIGLASYSGYVTTVSACETKVNLKNYGRFIELEETKYFDRYGDYHYQSICYDKDTKIIYIIEKCNNGIAISPFYVMNSENEPVIGVYTEAMEITE